MRIIGIYFLLLVLIVSFLITRNWKCNEKSPPFTGWSRSIEESKYKGAYQYEVAASKTNLALDSNHKLEIKNAWLENVWTSHVYMFSRTYIEKHDDYQLILVYNIINTGQPKVPDVYYFLGGRRSGDSLSHYYCSKSDSIKVPLFKSASRFLPSGEKRKAYDSLTFVRR
ncbi:hypothetical protein [Ferruginibacter profundus]